MNPAAFADLVAALRAAPSLPEALCRDLAHLMDVTGPLDAAPALELCNACPELDRCRAWARAQPARSLNGVIGGEIYEWRSWRGGKAS